MRKRIRINGILYESIEKDKGKFGQIEIENGSKSSSLTIVDNDYERLYLEFRKRKPGEYDVVTLSDYEGAEYEDILLAEKSSKALYDKIVDYILEADNDRADRWDKRSVERLVKDIKRKFNFVSFDEEEPLISKEWYEFNFLMDDEDPWYLAVKGEVTLDDIEGYLVGSFDPDSYDKDEYREYERDSKRYKDSYFYRQGWMDDDGHILSYADMVL